MISLKQLAQKKRNQEGFTIVELLIVIVVIGILALLVITTYNGIQAKARDAKRKSDVGAIQTQLEAYYSNNNHYPSLPDMNSSTWLASNMSSLDTAALQDPSGSSSAMQVAVASKIYSYSTNAGVSSPTCANSGVATGGTTDTTCTQYTLTATLEGGGTFSKTQLD